MHFRTLPERSYNVEAMPTFVLIKNHIVVATVVGANREALLAAIQSHAPPAPATCNEGSAKDVPILVKLMSPFTNPSIVKVSLLEYLDSTQLNCLNESDTHNIKGILGNKILNTGNSYLESDSDEQLLLNLHFNQAIRIRSIVIHTADASYAPKAIKLAINRPALGFEDVESATEPDMAQIIEALSPDDIANSRRISLKYVRFKSVRSLHIFVASNQGGEEETRINAIDVYGQPVETTNMANFRATEE
ncbi:PITH domain-containing protein At3g04780 [Arabidopsis thaliana] [Rhizoctonia solani]|uniref:PITH domain-containing protein At3g04780 [Arabidopsis thaliana] n=1 Tax=Rhizoctonia solani TaxID=456999 RepID=A0A0K6G906_9AGAM|nr:PITH domain-containing protein At3g04780 [Arabidopsis thaliana] [Rhizoctonia solani]